MPLVVSSFRIYIYAKKHKSVSYIIITLHVHVDVFIHCNTQYLLNRDFGLRSFQLMSGKSFRIQECLKTQSGEENSSFGRFNPVGCLQLLGQTKGVHNQSRVDQRTSGSIVDPLCLSEEWKSRDRKCLGRKTKPYLKRITPKAPRLLKTTHRVETSK